MNADSLASLTEQVLSAVFEVSNTLGAGFLEKVYRRALLAELRLRGIRAATEVSFAVTYKGQSVGEYFADRRRRAGSRAKVCRTARQRAHRSVPQLSASFWPSPLPSRQFPEAEG
jgi:hypothetical protein